MSRFVALSSSLALAGVQQAFAIKMNKQLNYVPSDTTLAIVEKKLRGDEPVDEEELEDLILALSWAKSPWEKKILKLAKAKKNAASNAPIQNEEESSSSSEGEELDKEFLDGLAKGKGRGGNAESGADHPEIALYEEGHGPGFFAGSNGKGKVMVVSAEQITITACQDGEYEVKSVSRSRSAKMCQGTFKFDGGENISMSSDQNLTRDKVLSSLIQQVADNTHTDIKLNLKKLELETGDKKALTNVIEVATTLLEKAKASNMKMLKCHVIGEFSHEDLGKKLKSESRIQPELLNALTKKSDCTVVGTNSEKTLRDRGNQGGKADSKPSFTLTIEF